MEGPRVYDGGLGVKHPGQSLVDFTFQQMQHFAALGPRAPPAQVDAATGLAQSFDWLLKRSVQAAAGWRALGLRTGDTLAVCSNNNHALFPAVLGAIFNGCTVAAIIPSSNTDELREALQLLEPRALLSDALTMPRMAAAADGQVHVVSVPEQSGELVCSSAISTDDLFLMGEAQGPGPDDFKPAAIADPKQHVAYIPFSSGTTGKPKAVMISDYAMLMFALNSGSLTVLEGERFLVTSPLSWISGTLMLSQCTLVGATRVFMDGCRDEHTWLRTIQQHQISLTLAPPWLLCMVAAALKAGDHGPCDLRSLRAVTIGGASLGADTQALLNDVLGCPVAHAFGCTEAGIAFSDSTGLPGQPPPRPGSLGILQPWVQHRLVDPTSGRDVPDDKAEGELRYKAPFLMLGYLRDSKATAQAFDEHGFYCTGDLVRRDSDGYYYFVERIKELMKFNSLPVAAIEVEDVLLFHPLVREACVIGRPNAIHGDLPTAFVVRSGNLQSNDQKLRDDLHQLIRARLSDHKQLRGGIYFVDDLPKTSSGKMDRKKLKKRLASAEEMAKLDSCA